MGNPPLRLYPERSLPRVDVQRRLGRVRAGPVRCRRLSQVLGPGRRTADRRRRAAGRHRAQVPAHGQLGGRSRQLDADAPRGIPAASRLRSDAVPAGHRRPDRGQPADQQSVPARLSQDDGRPGGGQPLSPVLRGSTAARFAAAPRIGRPARRAGRLAPLLGHERCADVRVLGLVLAASDRRHQPVLCQTAGVRRPHLRPPTGAGRRVHHDRTALARDPVGQPQAGVRSSGLRRLEPPGVARVHLFAGGDGLARPGVFCRHALQSELDLVEQIARISRVPEPLPVLAAARNVRRRCRLRITATTCRTLPS